MSGERTTSNASFPFLVNTFNLFLGRVEPAQLQYLFEFPLAKREEGGRQARAQGKKEEKLVISQMLKGLQCHGYLVQCVTIANYAFLCAMELNMNEEITCK